MIKFLKLIENPCVVATVTGVDDLEFIKKTSLEELTAIADIFEFRVDNFAASGSLDDLEAALREFSLPALITPRHPSEGGVEPTFEDIDVRKEAIRRFQPYAAAIDIELEQIETVRSALDPALPVVASFHNFTGTPLIEELRARIVYCRKEESIAVVKFAMVIETMPALMATAGLTEATITGGQKISSMGMGPMGKLSRLVFAKAGSCLNYGYLQHENAPGQWPAAELKRLIGEI